MDRFTLHHILSREKTDAAVNHGRIDKEKCIQLEKLINMTGMDEVFICGPESMIFSVKEWLEEKGLDKKRIHFELFTTPLTGGQQQASGQLHEKATQTGRQKMGQVTVKLDGIAFEYDGQAILDAALQQGADLPFACKGGVCATCRAKLVEGQVEMDINYALEPEEIEQGFILTCQSHPRTEKVVVDFDAR
jgi:ring-1,2-phenylacetyl-CoA epoxidase subunit PaaE